MSLNIYLNPFYVYFKKTSSMLFCLVKILDMDNLDCLIDWIYNFIVKENYTQAPHYCLHSRDHYKDHGRIWFQAP